MPYLIAGLIAGNFFYQYLGAHNWAVALDRSYFQLMAVGAVLVFRWLEGRGAGV